MEELIKKIQQKHASVGIDIYPPASKAEMLALEKRIGFSLPDDFLEFYSLSNGFYCTEDLFAFTSLSDIIENDFAGGKNWFYFSEYMIFCDMWGLRKTDKGKFEIFNARSPEFVLTSSLHHFLAKFLAGDVFDDGGLNDWLEKKERKGGEEMNKALPEMLTV